MELCVKHMMWYNRLGPHILSEAISYNKSYEYSLSDINFFYVLCLYVQIRIFS